jgi:hypothetical protein
MNAEQVDKLKAGVTEWNEWRLGHPQIRPNLAKAPLRALDLSNANLAKADLSGADLRGSTLKGADLRDADLTAANFFKAELTGAKLSGCDLRGARFLNPDQLMSAMGWQSARRDEELVLGAPIPKL